MNMYKTNRTICFYCGETLPKMEPDVDSCIFCPKCDNRLLVCSVCGEFLSVNVIPMSRMNPKTGGKCFYCCGDCGDTLDQEHPDWPDGGCKLEDLINDIGIDAIKKEISLGKPGYYEIQFCNVCGYKTKPHEPLTLLTHVGVVCDQCGRKYVPELFELMKHFNDTKVDEWSFLG